MRSLILFVWVLISSHYWMMGWSSMASSSTTTKDEDKKENSATSSSSSSSNNNEKDQCELYIAPSNIVDAGWGMFTAVDIKEMDPIGGGGGGDDDDGSIILHLHDLLRHHGPKGKASMMGILSDYDWQDPLFLGHYEADDSFSILPGLGSSANSHAGLFNMSPISSKGPTIDSAGLDRNDLDPGVGAFTYYHGVSAEALKDIPAGSELFLYDGDDFFNDREWGSMPLEQDFHQADKLLHVFHEFATINPEQLSSTALDELWHIVKNSVGTDPRTQRLAQALPQQRSDLDQALEAGGSAEYFSPQMERSTSWLERNGYCADHITVQTSTIQQAGRGAFASRFIPKGEVISLFPLLPMVHPQILDLYELHKDSSQRWTKNTNNVKQQQLFVNYCLGHEQSPLLLFPYAPGSNMINHGPPNSHLQWNSQSFSKWKHMSLKELDNAKESILAMELIASRDIQKGEEIFMNYGSNWENAWNQHVATFPQRNQQQQHNHQGSKYEYAWKKNAEQKPFPTHDEKDKIPSNLQITCLWDSHTDNEDIPDEESLLEQFGYKVIESKYEIIDDDYVDWVPCSIVNRSDDNAFYDVILEGPEWKTKIWNYLTQVPSSAIQYMDRPYTSDVWLPTAFRHPIEIPDHLFPEQWKTLPP